LRPIGRIRIDHEEHEAVSDGDLLPIGMQVVVVASRPTELVVRRAPETSA
jgi:membrane protein implicated in regulation of membrane protease activity